MSRWKITPLAQLSGGNEGTDRSMQLLASSWQAAERLIPRSPCPAAGSIDTVRPTAALSYTNTHSTSILYDREGREGGQESGICSELT